MKHRVFLDTNVFIYAFEFSESNSRKIIGLLNTGSIEGIISERVLEEITHYFKKFYNKKLANMVRYYVLQSCQLVFKEEVKQEMRKLKKKIKEKDLEQIAVVKKFGLKYIISYDKDFAGFKEYLTPKKFIVNYGLKPSKTEF
ncbi:MAG: PIN domain-containing protein [Candidatus Thermoplasmatota archaeon]|nr:PIN domain-containing protein [Candidatus Thermoplasmatota archaeon]